MEIAIIVGISAILNVICYTKGWNDGMDYVNNKMKVHLITGLKTVDTEYGDVVPEENRKESVIL